jgi:hypothetical protein
VFLLDIKVWALEGVKGGSLRAKAECKWLIVLYSSFCLYSDTARLSFLWSSLLRKISSLYVWFHTSLIIARSHLVANWGPIALAHSLDHSLGMRHFKRLCQPMLVWDAAALLRRMWLAHSDAPNGGRGRDASSLLGLCVKCFKPSSIASHISWCIGNLLRSRRRSSQEPVLYMMTPVLLHVRTCRQSSLGALQTQQSLSWPLSRLWLELVSLRGGYMIDSKVRVFWLSLS